MNKYGEIKIPNLSKSKYLNIFLSIYEKFIKPIVCLNGFFLSLLKEFNSCSIIFSSFISIIYLKLYENFKV